MGNSTGLFQLDDKAWGFRVRLTVNGKTVDIRRTKDEKGNILRTKTEASRARKRAILEAEERCKATSDNNAITSKTFAEVYNIYCQFGRTEKAYNTRLKQDSLWKNHIGPRFGAKYLDEVTVGEIQDYLGNLYYEQGYAYRYVEGFLKMFYLIYGQAHSRNFVSTELYSHFCTNKLTKIHMPKLKTDEDLDIVAFTQDERRVLEDIQCRSR